MYICCSTKIEKHVESYQIRNAGNELVRPWENPRSNFFWFPVGGTNSLMSNFISEWNKYYMNIAKKMAESLAEISRSMSGTNWIQTVRSTILKCVQINKEATFYKVTNIRQFLVDLHFMAIIKIFTGVPFLLCYGVRKKPGSLKCFFWMPPLLNVANKKRS